MTGWSHEITSPSLFMNGFRSVLSWIDWGVYSIIKYIYKVFFYVSTATIFDGATINAFFSRIQLIIGIFMIFKLSISLLELIVNPDLAKDRNAGTGKIVARVLTSLLMLTLVVPLKIPGAAPQTYNGFINDNGILFGTLYAIQYRVLSENILAKIVLGNSGPNQEGTPDASSGISNAGNLLATSILRGFITINVKDENVTQLCGDNAGNENVGENSCANVICPAEVQDSSYWIEGEKASIESITDATSLKCSNDGKKYAFAYRGLISTVVGVVVIIILLGFTIDVAVRALKLAVLRLIAPIPIISYVDPKSSKDGAFAAWTKTLTSTYLDLFVRLIIIYFVVAVIQELSQHGAVLAPGATGFTKILTYIFIVIGALFFAKQAPNFIKTMLGSKGVGFGPGLSGALGFMGGVIGGGGLAGAAAAGMAAANTTNEAQAQGKQGPGGWSTGRDLVTKMRTGDDKAVGGILNRAQRALTNRGSRVVGARVLQRQYGITADEADKAKVEMFQAQDTASDMANMRGNFNMSLGGSFDSLTTKTAAGTVSAIDTKTKDGQLLDDFVRTHSGDANVQNWLNGTMSDDAFMDYMVNTTQTEFQKQKKNYEDADALLKKYGNGVSPEDKYATGASRYYARARNKVAEVASKVPGVRDRGRRAHNDGYGKGGWERTYVDQGKPESSQETPKYSGSKDWNDINKK